MKRREIFVGIASSIIFGALHNFTEKGITTKTVPSSQTLGGLFYWYLQRKFGIVANSVAHILHNFKAFS